jgi:hypothetical protein
MPFNPYVALGGVLAFIAAVTGAFFEGKHVEAGEVAKQQLNQLVKALDDRDAKQKQIDALEQQAAVKEQQRQVEVRNVYTEIPKIIDRPVYHNQCVDDDGVRLLDRARAAASGNAGSDPSAPARPSDRGAGGPAHR